MNLLKNMDTMYFDFRPTTSTNRIDLRHNWRHSESRTRRSPIKHVLHLDNSYWDKEHIVDMDIEQILIKLVEDSDSDDSSDELTLLIKG